MKLNCIHWWGSSSGAFESVEYFFIVITSKSTPIQCLLEYLFENYWYKEYLKTSMSKQMICLIK